MQFFRSLGFGAAMVALAGHAHAGPLHIVSVRAPLHCFFRIPCPVNVTQPVDTVDTIPISSLVWSGTAEVTTRTYEATPSPAVGKSTFYEYRIDLSQTTTTADAACVTDMSVDFGPIAKVQYSPIGPAADVYVIVQPNAGTIGLLGADETNGIVTFTFSQPVCAATATGPAESTRFFGMASTLPPQAISATVSVPGLDPIAVKVRAPGQKK